MHLLRADSFCFFPLTTICYEIFHRVMEKKKKKKGLWGQFQQQHTRPTTFKLSGVQKFARQQGAYQPLRHLAYARLPVARRETGKNLNKTTNKGKDYDKHVIDERGNRKLERRMRYSNL